MKVNSTNLPDKRQLQILPFFIYTIWLTCPIELSKNTADSYFGVLHFLEDSFHERIDLGIESNFKPIIKPYIMKEIIYV